MRKWLKELRLGKGLTQQNVADRSGVKRSYYTMIETGNRTPSVQVAKAIALVIGFDWTIFLKKKVTKRNKRMSFKNLYLTHPATSI